MTRTAEFISVRNPWDPEADRISKDHPTRTYARGRECGFPTCPTPLSIYNPGPDCFAHTAPEILPNRVDAGRPRKS